MSDILKTTKGDIMRSMMKSPETARLIREAMSSPVGSTSRAKTKKMFAILGKVHGLNDGAGGPGMAMYQEPEEPQTHDPIQSSKNIVIFHKIPKPKIHFGTKPPKKEEPKSQRLINDGAGGPGVQDGAGGWFTDAYDSFTNAASALYNPLNTATVKNALSNAGNNAEILVGSALNSADSFTNAASALYNPLNTATVKNALSNAGNNAEILVGSALNSAIPAVSNAVSSVGNSISNSLGSTKDNPGLLSKAGQYVVNTAIPAVAKGVASVALAPTAVGQYVGQNLTQAAIDAKNSASKLLFGYNNSDPSTSSGPGYTTLGNTAAGGLISGMYSSPSTTTTSPTTSYPKLATQQMGPQNNPYPSTVTANDTKVYSTLNGINYNAAGNSITPTAPTTPTTSPQAYKTTTTGGSPLPGSNTSAFPVNGDYSTSAFGKATSSVESSGNYQAVGPAIKEGQNKGYSALGKYQIMPNLHFASIGLNADNPADVQKFLSTPALQDQLYNKIMGDLMSKYNNDPAKAFAAYFGGDLAVQNLGTPEGDKQSDGNLTVNQYVAKAMEALTANGGSANFSTSYQSAPTGLPTTSTDNSALGRSVSNAIKTNQGAGMFALSQLQDKNNPVTHGKTLEEALVDNEAAIRKKYDIDALKEKKYKTEQEGLNLPTDMATYIRDRDTYIADTDRKIEEYKKYMAANNDMSNPDNVRKMNSYLNSLYTMRGMQNQSYMGYIQKAAEIQQKKIDTVTKDYSDALDKYKDEVTKDSAITQGKYQLYTAALADMYKEVQDAPTKALQYEYLQKQYLTAATVTPSDSVKTDYLAQSKSLEGVLFDDKRMAKKGVDIVNEINRFAVLEPNLKQANIIASFQEGLDNYMNAPESEGTASNPGINAKSKQEMAEYGIQQYANLTNVALANNNDAYANLGVENAYKLAGTLASQVQNRITSSGQAPQLVEAIKTLAPTGWFGNKKSPTEAEFLATVAKTTGGSIDQSIAKAIYAVFQRYIADNGAGTTSPASAVQTILYNTGSTENRAAPVPYTPEEVARNVGWFYALTKAQEQFSNPQAASKFQTAVYGNQ